MWNIKIEYIFIDIYYLIQNIKLINMYITLIKYNTSL